MVEVVGVEVVGGRGDGCGGGGKEVVKVVEVV